MANKKISQLDPAAALTGTEELPIVQSGTTVKTTVQDIADKTPIPNLQQITDVGNTTSNEITAFVVRAGNGNIDDATLYEDGTVSGAQIQVINSSNNKTGRIIGNNLTDDRVYSAPNANGTLALTSDITEPYLVYTAVISQSGTDAPTVDYVLRNTLGFTPTFTYVQQGEYYIAAPSSNWTTNKIIIFINSGYPSQDYTIGWSRNSNTYITIHTKDSSGSKNGLLFKATLELRKYP